MAFCWSHPLCQGAGSGLGFPGLHLSIPRLLLSTQTPNHKDPYLWQQHPVQLHLQQHFPGQGGLVAQPIPQRAPGDTLTGAPPPANDTRATAPLQAAAATAGRNSNEQAFNMCVCV